MRESYKTLNNRLLRRIGLAKSKKAQKKVADKIFGAYSTKLKKNSSNYFKSNIQASIDFNNYTIATIRNRVYDHISKGKFDVDVLRGQLNRLVIGSREFQEQKKQVNKQVEAFNEDSPNQKYIYKITSPTKNNAVSDHDPNCYRDSQKRLFTQKEMIETSKQLPRHKNCRCRFVKDTSKILIEQGNF